MEMEVDVRQKDALVWKEKAIAAEKRVKELSGITKINCVNI